jgi:hypothetical protein
VYQALLYTTVDGHLLMVCDDGPLIRYLPYVARRFCGSFAGTFVVQCTAQYAANVSSCLGGTLDAVLTR